MTDEQAKLALGWMLEDMARHRLEVRLVPAKLEDNPGQMVRRAVGQNVEWYREFCSRYPSQRKRPRRGRHFDTKIKRANVVRVLGRLLAVGFSSSPYVEDFMEIADEMVREVFGSAPR